MTKMVKNKKSSKAKTLPVRNTVRAVIYRRTEQGYDFLLLYKVGTKNYWQNPQGGQKRGEGPLEALLRESEEETGIPRSSLELINSTEVKKEYITLRRGTKTKVNLTAYAVKVNGVHQIKLSKEHNNFKWVSYDKARLTMGKYQEQIQVFDEICKELFYQHFMRKSRLE
ncbi:MAG: NUDIX domain-containing protein [archaeon]|nr:NUDIX domain-containing protein [archaeon]